MARRLIVVAMALAAMPCWPAMADENPTKTLGAYINNQTFYVLHVRLDPKQVQGFLDKLTPFYGPAASSATAPAAQPKTTPAKLKQIYAEISKLGVNEFYFVAPFDGDETLILPIKAGTDTKALAKAFGFETQYDPRGLSLPEWKKMLHKSAYFVDGGFLLLGTNSSVSDFLDRNSSSRPELGDGFDALGDAPVRLVVAPSPAMLDILASRHHELTSSLGSVQVKSLLGGVQWIAASATMNPAGLEIIVQAKDQEKAKAISAAANEVLSAASKYAASQPLRWRVENELPAMLMAGMAGDLKLKVAGSMLRLKLDDQQINPVLEKTLPAALLAVAQGQKLEHSQIKIRGIAAAIKYYVSEHKDYPPDLQALEKDLGGKDMFVHPVNPQITPGYIYIKPAAAKKVLMVYENYPTFPALGIFVAFADGSTTLVANEEQFKKLVEEAKK